MCTGADSGLQKVQGMYIGVARGAQGMMGKAHRVTGKDFHTDRGFLMPEVFIDIPYTTVFYDFYNCPRASYECYWWLRALILSPVNPVMNFCLN